MEYKGYEVVQAFNNHIQVIKDGRMVMHMSCTKKLNEEEIKRAVDDYIGFVESKFGSCEQHCNRCRDKEKCIYGVDD